MIMIKKKKIFFLIICIVVIQLLLSDLTISSSYFNRFSTSNSELSEDHLIENVPYIGQSGPYCAYASQAMIYHYYGVNTSEKRILYNSGVGFSLAYLPQTRLVVGGVGTSVYDADREFLASLYGLSYEYWMAPSGLSDEEAWEEYWLRIKQNISKDIPVWTCAYALFLPSIRAAIEDSFNIPEEMWNVIPGLLWDLFIENANAGHSIVIIGYNESNQTLCYNDPGVELFSHPEYGEYVWMNLSDYKYAVQIIPKKTNISYWVGAFQNLSTTPLNLTDAFNLTLQRNIERMKGNKSAYDNTWSEAEVGINALKTLKKNFEPGIKNRFITYLKYKYKAPLKSIYKLGIFLNKLLPDLINQTQLENMANLYYMISYEKRDVAEYLWEIKDLLNDTHLSNICRENSILLNQEAENWSKISSYYSLMLKRGSFMTLPRGMITIYFMNKVLDNIIKIEEEIIDNVN